MLYIAIAAVWCLLAFAAFAICRLAGLSDDAHTLELAEWVARGGWRSREQARADIGVERLFEGRGEARRATG